MLSIRDHLNFTPKPSIPKYSCWREKQYQLMQSWVVRWSTSMMSILTITHYFCKFILKEQKSTLTVVGQFKKLLKNGKVYKQYRLNIDNTVFYLKKLFLIFGYEENCQKIINSSIFFSLALVEIVKICSKLFIAHY